LLEDAGPVVAARGLTLLGITVSNLDDEHADGQLTLPIDEPASDALDKALDAVRDRFGPTAVTRASVAGRDPGLAAWLPPEGGRRRPGRGSPRPPGPPPVRRAGPDQAR
ncbi:MAG: hypothetical protein AB7O53_19105, partial [Thermoleophilia bacterium]